MTMQKQLFIGLCILALIAGCSGVAPKITEDERQEIAAAGIAYNTDVVYDQALALLGAYINTETSQQKIIQPKAIANVAGGQELPMNITDMVITGLSRLAGNKFIVAPFDPEYILNDASSGGAGSRILPQIVVGGSITEFDKELDMKSGDSNLDTVLDRGEPDTNLSAQLSNGMKFSRVSLDLYLIDYRTHTVIPGASVTNTISIAEIEKGREFAFAIYGNGLGISGKIKHSEGFHRAVRNLVDYSLLQLVGRYYNFPYWRALGQDEIDPKVMASLKKSFMMKDERGQHIVLQHLLNEYSFGDSVVNAATGRSFSGKIIPNGRLEEKSLTYIEAFKAKYNVKTEMADMGGLYAALIRYLPIGAAKQAGGQAPVSAGQADKMRDFLTNKDRFGKVPRSQAIEGY
ncbi:MAG TPA: hypothetical protein DEB25_01810 [Desulfobulbaceae bacterium]|nr:hypothetical protein [Desulfobulbaceae bacterium]